MEGRTHYRPRVGRETRMLVATALCAVLALWMLARLRFPAPSNDSGVVSDILSARIAGDFDALAAQVGRVRGFVGTSLSTVELEPAGPDAAPVSVAALRLGGDVAVVHMPDGARLRASAGVELLARNSASGLAVVRLPGDPAPSSATPRLAPPLVAPQYVVATTVYPDGVALRPVFVGAAARVDAPLWAASAYAIPPQTDVAPGAFLFTRDGEFAGLAIELNGAMAFVSGDTVRDEADRLIAAPATPAPDYGIQVHDLTASLRRALRAETGVVVAWVDPSGPSRGVLSQRDVIETAGGQPVLSSAHWRRHVATLRESGPVSLGIRRSFEARRVTVTPVPVDLAHADAEGQAGLPSRSLGASLRPSPGAGSEVIAVEPGSLASRADLRPGDIIVSMDDVTAPTPAQVRRAAAGRDPKPVILTVRRDDEHHLLVLEP